MVSLAEAAAQPVRRDPRMRCGVEVWLRSLAAGERAGAEELIRQSREEGRPVPDVWEHFTGHGFPHRVNVIQVHKREACACYR